MTFLLANLVFFDYCSPHTTVLWPHTSHKATHILTHIKCNLKIKSLIINSWYNFSCQDPSISPYCLLLSPKDFLVSCLRLQTPTDCIPHSFHMYTKCFNTYLSCGWAYGSALTLLCLWRSGVEFRKIGEWWSLSDVAMSWLRLQTYLESIPHPFHMYTKCFSPLIRCGWAYGYALTLLRQCRSGVSWAQAQLML